MIEYELLIADGTSFALNSDSSSTPLRKALYVSGSAYTAVANIVERSYEDGAIKVGEARAGSSTLTVTVALSFESDDEARSYLNQLMAYASEALFLVDKTNGIRTSITVTTITPVWDEGCYLRSGELSLVFVQLSSFWESVEEQEVTAETIEIVPSTVTIANDGFTQCPFVVVVSSSVACPLVEIKDTVRGTILLFENDVFGTEGFSEMIIDGEKGTAVLSKNSGEVTVDCLSSSQDGAGFFRLARGANELTLRTTSAATFSFTFRERYYA